MQPWPVQRRFAQDQPPPAAPADDDPKTPAIGNEYDAGVYVGTLRLLRLPRWQRAAPSQRTAWARLTGISITSDVQPTSGEIPAILAPVRQMLTVVGTAFGAKDYLDTSDIEPVIGALRAIGSVVWSAADKRGR